MDADEVLDCRGLSCPMPILKLVKHIKGMETGKVLELLGTDPGSEEDVPAWCEKAGHTFLGMEEEDGVYKFYIRKE